MLGVLAEAVSGGLRGGELGGELGEAGLCGRGGLFAVSCPAFGVVGVV